MTTIDPTSPDPKIEAGIDLRRELIATTFSVGRGKRVRYDDATIDDWQAHADWLRSRGNDKKADEIEARINSTGDNA